MLCNQPHQSEVQAFQPHPFNHFSHWDVATIARNAHLMCSMDQKLDRKGGARPHPHQHHPVPLRPPFSINHKVPAGSPQIIPQRPLQSQYQNTHIAFMKFSHTCPHGSSPHFLHGCILHTIVDLPLTHTLVCLINYRGLTFDIPWKQSKVTSVTKYNVYMLGPRDRSHTQPEATKLQQCNCIQALGDAHKLN